MRYDGVDAAELAARLRTPGLLCLEEVTSTLDLAHELAQEGAPAGTVVLADEQVRGRGRLGRYWHSPKGCGVWLGYIARPETPLESGVLALRVGLVVAEALGTLGCEAWLKWPNDVILADRKAAGVLCEARHAGMAGWIAIGIGVNVRGPLPDEIASMATVLEEHVRGMTRLAVLEALVPRLHGLAYAPTLNDAEREAYARYDWLHGRALLEPLAGTARGIAPDGALLVETVGGTERVVAGSVRAA